MGPKKEVPTRDLLPTLTLPVTDDDHHIHPVAARYVLVEYGDFECPDCAEGYHVVKELLRDLGEDLCYVFRSFPQPDIHPNSQFAAEAAEAADMQGRFWLMHDRLFEHQAELSPRRIRELAWEISLDIHRFEEDLASGEAKRRVDSVRAEGVRSGVEDTPTFFADGRMQVGSYEYQPLYDALTANRRGKANSSGAP